MGDWSGAATSQKTKESTRSCKPRTESESLKQAQSYQNRDFGLLVSRTRKDYVSVVMYHQVCVNLVTAASRN